MDKTYLLDLRDKASFDEYKKPAKISKIIPQIDPENDLYFLFFLSGITKY